MPSAQFDKFHKANYRFLEIENAYWDNLPVKEEYSMSHHITITKFSIRYIFSLFVVNARHEKMLTQEDLAALVYTSRRWIQLIESGKRMPSLYLAVNLIAVL
jgi:ribosome-binding protein aMBF1 (putative translation factor)